MKEAIKYNFGFNDVQIKECKNGYYFYYLDYKYYLLRYDLDIDNQIKISEYLYKNNIKVNTFVMNKDNKYKISINSINYVLIKVNDIESEEITLDEIIKFNNLLSPTKINIPLYSTLWSSKVDLIEEELKDYEEDYPLIEEYTPYFIGLAENAISYFKDTIEEENIESVKINLNHKRIPYKLTRGFINNPINFKIDFEIRDISEYLKSKVLNEESVIDDIYYIRDLNMSKASYRILYSRLLYPTYYFDLLIDVITNNKEETEIKGAIDKIEIYKEFLKEYHSIINERISLPKIEWLYK